MKNRTIPIYWKQIYAHLRSRCFCTHHEAEDLTQELFSRLITKDNLVELEARFTTSLETRNYLLAAARNLHRSRHRDQTCVKRGGSYPVLSLDRDDDAGWLGASDQSPSPAVETERKELRELWEREVGSLAAAVPPRRANLFAAVRDSLDPQQPISNTNRTATTLGIPPGTLRVQMHRWRENLFGKMRAALSH